MMAFSLDWCSYVTYIVNIEFSLDSKPNIKQIIYEMLGKPYEHENNNYSYPIVPENNTNMPPAMLLMSSGKSFIWYTGMGTTFTGNSVCNHTVYCDSSGNVRATITKPDGINYTIQQMRGECSARKYTDNGTMFVYGKKAYVWVSAGWGGVCTWCCICDSSHKASYHPVSSTKPI